MMSKFVLLALATLLGSVDGATCVLTDFDFTALECQSYFDRATTDACPCLAKSKAKNLTLTCKLDAQMTALDAYNTCFPATSGPSQRPITQGPTGIPTTSAPVIGTKTPTKQTAMPTTQAPSTLTPTKSTKSPSTGAPTKRQCGIAALLQIIPSAAQANCSQLSASSTTAQICSCIGTVPNTSSNLEKMECEAYGRNLKSEWQLCQPTSAPSIRGTTGSPTRIPTTATPTTVTKAPTSAAPSTDTSKAPTTFLAQCNIDAELQTRLTATVSVLAAHKVCAEVLAMFLAIQQETVDPIKVMATDFCPCLAAIPAETKAFYQANLSCQSGGINLKQKLTCTASPTKAPTTAVPPTAGAAVPTINPVNGVTGIFSSHSSLGLAVVVPLAACFLSL